MRIIRTEERKTYLVHILVHFITNLDEIWRGYGAIQAENRDAVLKTAVLLTTLKIYCCFAFIHVWTDLVQSWYDECKWLALIQGEKGNFLSIDLLVQWTSYSFCLRCSGFKGQNCNFLLSLKKIFNVGMQSHIYWPVSFRLDMTLNTIELCNFGPVLNEIDCHSGF